MQRAACALGARAAVTAPAAAVRRLAAGSPALAARPLGLGSRLSSSSSSSSLRRARPTATTPALPAAAAVLPLDAQLSTHAAAAFELAEGLEAPVQLAYLVTLMGFLVVGAYLVVRQVLIRRELEEAAKVLGERVRTGEATSEDYFELGVILLRKKLYTQATKNLEKAQKAWEGEPDELAQVHNALGYAYFNMEKTEAAVAEYKKAVQLQPGYVTAWNNLGDAYERKKAYSDALAAYTEALTYAPDNKVAQARGEYCRTRLQRAA